MIGQTISHYKVTEKLGEGGMGVVYRAEDLRLKRSVALKFLAGQALGGEEITARFRREAEAAASLNHPNICTIYEIDETEGRSFIVMEYVKGQSLKDKIEDRPLKLDEALDIATQATQALHAAHEESIAHRDIKSANIMITRRGQVKVMDFGLAQLGGSSKLTKTGSTLGTPAYMSPEQANGQETDGRTDIWSLGVVTYEMVTGQLPFQGEFEAAVVYSILNEVPEPLTALRSGVPIELDRIVSKALAKNPDERYQHVDELEVDLRALRKSLPVSEGKPARDQINSTSAVAAVGQTLGHYKLEAKLGEGGMGAVYRALDTHLDRPVAVKVLTAEAAANQERQKRFAQEAKAASALNHPNIVHIYDIGEAAGVGYIAMEYVEGKTLDSVVGRRGLALGEAFKYAVQITDALAKAHGAGIVHRDIKPGNIMVTGDGLVKVLDFGLAKLTEPTGVTSIGVLKAADQPKTSEGAILGTVAYMSPEQAEGKPVDARSDIFSFGSVLYEMLTGRRAFGGETRLSVLAAILREDPKPVSELDRGMPREVEKVVSRCLRKDPKRRFQHMEDLKVALEELKEESDSGTLTAPQATVGSAARLWGDRKVVASALAVLLIVVVLGWRVGSRGPPAESPTLYKTIQVTRDNGLTWQPSLSLDGKFVAYASDRSGEGNLDIWNQQIGGGDPLRLTSHPANDDEPSYSADGTEIVFRSDRDQGGIYVVSAMGGNERFLAAGGETPRFSPNGEWVAYSVVPTPGSREIYVVPAVGGEPRKLQVDFSRSGRPVWSPAGDHLLFTGSASEEQDLWVAPLEGGEAVKTGFFDMFRGAGLRTPVPYGVGYTWAPDGSQIVFEAIFGRTWNLWRVPISQETWQITGEPQRLTGGEFEYWPSVSKDGLVAYSRINYDSDIWGVEIDADRGQVKGEPVRVTEGPGMDIDPSVSPDGKTLAFMSANRSEGLADIWVKDMPSGTERRFTFSPERDVRPRISPDGSRVAFYRQLDKTRAVYVVPLEGGAEEKILESEEFGAIFCWSSDSRKVLYIGGKPRRVSTVDVETREITHLLHVPKAQVGGPQLAPDDRWISFNLIRGRVDRTLYIAPLRKGAATGESEWIPIAKSAKEHSPSKNWWSPNGQLLYFRATGEGSSSVWAQPLHPATKQPLGSAFEVLPPPEQRFRLNRFPGYSLVSNHLYQTRQERTANIWLAEPVEPK